MISLLTQVHCIDLDLVLHFFRMIVGYYPVNDTVSKPVSPTQYPGGSSADIRRNMGICTEAHITSRPRAQI